METLAKKEAFTQFRIWKVDTFLGCENLFQKKMQHFRQT